MLTNGEYQLQLCSSTLSEPNSGVSGPNSGLFNPTKTTFLAKRGKFPYSLYL